MFHLGMKIIFLFVCFFFFLIFQMWKYDNTFIGDLENTEQNYI